MSPNCLLPAVCTPICNSGNQTSDLSTATIVRQDTVVASVTHSADSSHFPSLLTTKNSNPIAGNGGCLKNLVGGTHAIPLPRENELMTMSMAGKFSPSKPTIEPTRGALARRARTRHLFFTIPHPCLFLPPPHQTIWSTFSPCPRIWPIPCTQFMTIAMGWWLEVA